MYEATEAGRPGEAGSPPLLSGFLCLNLVLAGWQRSFRPDLEPWTRSIPGEEALAGWGPQSDSLILDHRRALEKLSFLQDVSVNENSAFKLHFRLYWPSSKGARRSLNVLV